MESRCIDRGVKGRDIDKNELGDGNMNIQTIRWLFVKSLYQVYEDEVYKTCLYFAKDEHIAKDMTQMKFHLQFVQLNLEINNTLLD